MVDLSVKIGSLELKNPVMTASGTFGFGLEYQDFYDINKLGAIVVKGTTLEKREGNLAPRMAETPMGMLNAVGLQNKGVDYFIKEYIPQLEKLTVPVIVNINGSTEDDYIELTKRLRGLPTVKALELNISCPNVKKGGMGFGTDICMAADLTKKVKAVADKPLIVKLSPNVTNIAAIAKSVEDNGADAVSLINTLLGMAVDLDTRRPLISTITAGLSGPAVKPVALRMVWQVANAVKIPVIGMGGISTARDALEFLMVGASAVAIGTANFVNPRAALDVVEGIEAFCREQNIKKIADFVGSLVIE